MCSAPDAGTPGRHEQHQGVHRHDRRHRCNRQGQGRSRRGHRRDRPAQEGGHDLQGPVPVPRGEDARASSSRPPARAGSASAAAWAATSSASSCSATACSFPEALKRLAARAGVELDERTDAARTPSASPPARGARGRDRLLPRGPDRSQGSAQPALDYLHGRGFTDETIADVPARLGARRLGRDEHARSIAKRNVPAGRAGRGRPDRAPARSAAAAPTTASASRIIFPIRDANGDAVGPRRPRSSTAPTEATTRATTGPKYLNSPATPLFDKSRTLYLIDRAKARDPQVRPGRDRRGLHRRADGPPGRLRQRRRQPRHGPHAGPGRARSPATRTKIALAYDVDPAGQSAGTFGVTELIEPHRRAPAPPTSGRRLDRRRRRPPARGQGPRRGHPRDARPVARGDPTPGRSSTT